MPFSLFPSSTASFDLSREVEPARARTSSDVTADVLRAFDAWAPALRRYVRGCGIAPDVADDIVQDTFVALFQHLQKDGGRANLRGWVMQVGYRLALKHRRGERRRGRWQGPWHAEAVTIPDRATGPEAACLAHDDHQRLRAVLRALPERERQCVYLRAEGLRYRQIADVLGISLGAVAKAVARAVGRLSAAIDQ